MQKLRLVILSCLCFVLSCDDGDVISVALEFDQELQLCGDENSDNYVIYDTKNDPNESLTLLFPTTTINNLIFNPNETPYSNSFVITGSTVRFNYRTYDGDPTDLICAEIPSSSVNITEDYEATSGTVNFTSTFIDDDNDTIPSALEDINQNGDLEDDDSDAEEEDLDSTSSSMWAWAKSDLQQVTADWIVAFVHQGPYSQVGSHDSDSETAHVEFRENFISLLERYGVDLVLSGHNHAYVNK